MYTYAVFACSTVKLHWPHRPHWNNGLECLQSHLYRTKTSRDGVEFNQATFTKVSVEKCPKLAMAPKKQDVYSLKVWFKAQIHCCVKTSEER